MYQDKVQDFFLINQMTDGLGSMNNSEIFDERLCFGSFLLKLAWRI